MSSAGCRMALMVLLAGGILSSLFLFFAVLGAGIGYLLLAAITAIGTLAAAVWLARPIGD